MAQDHEWAFVCCCCCHHHWQQQQHIHVYIVSISLNNVLSWQFYLISALNLFVSHASSCGPHMASESWHLGKMAQLWACWQLEKPKKAASFLSFCWRLCYVFDHNMRLGRASGSRISCIAPGCATKSRVRGSPNRRPHGYHILQHPQTAS